MLKTNCKKVNEALKNHILSYQSIDELKSNLDAVHRPQSPRITAVAADALVMGGCFLCYYSEIRDFLKNILEETDEEANRYSDSKVWELYKALLVRTITKLIGFTF